MQIILTATDDALESAWKKFCGDLDFVTIHRGSIFEVSCDAVVSPANSFGFMDGGIDHAYSRFFGWHVQERLQKKIAEQHGGELLVGDAELIETDHDRFPFLISAPTMRVPMKLKNSIHPFLAARAVFRLIQNGTFQSGVFAPRSYTDVIEIVAFPGLGTGVGGMGANTCAHQVRSAINDVILKKVPFPRTWAEAQSRHQLLYTDQVRDLQRD